jgi:hypothetical protein
MARFQLTDAIIDLAAAHLKRQFLFQTQRNRFGSLDALRELAISARGCIKPSLGSGRVTVAFVLERILQECAGDFGAGPARISEIAALDERLRPPVSRAVEFLTGAADDPVEIAAALIRARRPRER